MAFERRKDIALDSAHSHPERKQLHGKGLARAGGAKQGHVRDFVDARIEQVNDAQRVVVPVDAEQDT